MTKTKVVGELWPCTVCGHTTEGTAREVAVYFGGMAMAYKHADVAVCKLTAGKGPKRQSNAGKPAPKKRNKL